MTFAFSFAWSGYRARFGSLDTSVLFMNAQVNINYCRRQCKPHKNSKYGLSVCAALHSSGGHHVCMADSASDSTEGLHWQTIPPAASSSCPPGAPPHPPPPKAMYLLSTACYGQYSMLWAVQHAMGSTACYGQYSMVWVTLQILVEGPMQKHIPSASTVLQYCMQVCAAMHTAKHTTLALQGPHL